jgi:hypothetical protein
MLATLLIWIYAALLSFIYGLGCILLLKKAFHFEEDQFPSFSLISITGLVIITTLAGFLSLLINLGLATNQALVLGGMGILVLAHRWLPDLLREGFNRLKGSSPLIWLLCAALALFVLAKTTEPPQNYDTGLYHAQAIRWIETYRAVPGLGNLADRLAFNSAWFLPSALFSFSFLGLRSFHVLGGFIFLQANLVFLGKASRLLKGEFALSSVICLALIYLSRRLFGLELSSPGTDMPAALLTWIVFLLALEKIEAGAADRFDLHSTLIILISVFAVTLKLSAAPVLLLPLYFLLRELLARQAGALPATLVISTLVVVPWLARNIILSGYLVYPFAAIDLFNVDWKIPAVYVTRQANAIASWARLPQQDAKVVLQLPFTRWVPIWWRAQQAFSRQMLVGVGLGSCAWLVLSLASVLKPGKISAAVRRYAIIYLAGWAGITFWFASAPDIRFSYGFLAILLCLLAAPLIQWLLGRLRRFAIPSVAAVILILLFYQAYGVYRMHNQVRWLLPADYPSAAVTARTLSRFDTNMPTKGDQCWYAPLPCTPTHNPEVRMRGASLQDGFYNKNLRQP